MINVFLDDMRVCPNNFTLVKSVKKCIRMLETEEINVLSLDHDLGHNVPTGYDLCKWIVEHNIYPKIIYIHSSNPVGVNNMIQLLTRYAPKDITIKKVFYENFKLYC